MQQERPLHISFVKKIADKLGVIILAFLFLFLNHHY